MNIEEIIACILKRHPLVNEFTNNIMKKLKDEINKINEPNREKYINIALIRIKDNKIDKPGFTRLEYDNIDYNDGNNFHKIMGSIYGFMLKNEFFFEVIKNNEPLFNNIITTNINKLLNTEMTYSDCKELLEIDSSIIFNALSFSDCPNTLPERNLNSVDYIKKRLPGDIIHSISLEKLMCHSSISKDNEVDIVLPTTYYQFGEDTFYYNLCKKYNIKIVGGLSGSTFLTYNFIFNVLRFENNTLNKKLLLACIIADYVPLYHNLHEIIIIYYNYIGKPYKFTDNPIEWIKDVLGEYLFDLDKVIKYYKYKLKYLNMKNKIYENFEK